MTTSLSSHITTHDSQKALFFPTRIFAHTLVEVLGPEADLSSNPTFFGYSHHCDLGQVTYISIK
jgi:hypothetical protein